MRLTAPIGRISFRPDPPLDLDLTLQRFRLWGEDPANVYQEGVFFRVARVGADLIPFRLRSTGDRNRPRIVVDFRGPLSAAVRAAVRREALSVVGAQAPLAPFYAQVASDPVLATLVRPDGALWGLRPSLSPDPFELIVGAISAQQVNLPFAFATRARLVRRYGEPVTWNGTTVYAFPSPARLCDTSIETLRAMQFSTRKAEYIVGLAGEIASGRLELARLQTMSDQAVIDRLTAVRGLGRWTAEWFLARALGRHDACPADDLGVRRAIERFCFRGRPVAPARVRRRTLAWRPYRNLAVHYLLAAARLLAPAGRLAAAPVAAGA